jgi:hypothetical protein
MAKAPSPPAPEVVKLAQLKGPARLRAMTWLAARDWTDLRTQHPDVVHVTLGARSREGKTLSSAEPVLKAWVPKKLDEPADPLPKRYVVDYDLPPKGGSTARTRIRLSVPIDVVEACWEGTATAAAAPVRVRAHGDTGSLAARVSLVPAVAGVHRAWLSAAHVLTAYTSTGGNGPALKIDVRTGPPNPYLGTTITASCWLPALGFRTDAGLVAEEAAAAVPTDAKASDLIGWLTVHEIRQGIGSSMNAKYRAVDQTSGVHALDFVEVRKAGTKLVFPPQDPVVYPRLLAFSGTGWAPIGGDSGTCVYREDADGLRLAGVLVGRLNNGQTVALPAEDIVFTLQAALQCVVEVIPDGI